MMLFCLLFFLSCHDWLFQNHFDLFSLYANAMIFNCICIQITSPGGTPIRGKPARYRHAHLSWLPLLHSLPPLPFLYLCVSITSRLSSVHATDSVCANSLHKVMYGLGGTHTHSLTHTHTRDCVKKKHILIIIKKKNLLKSCFLNFFNFFVKLIWSKFHVNFTVNPATIRTHLALEGRKLPKTSRSSFNPDTWGLRRWNRESELHEEPLPDEGSSSISGSAVCSRSTMNAASDTFIFLSQALNTALLKHLDWTLGFTFFFFWTRASFLHSSSSTARLHADTHRWGRGWRWRECFSSNECFQFDYKI